MQQPRMNSWPAIQNTLKRVEGELNPFERVSYSSRRIHSMAILRGHDPHNTRLTLDR
jgi:hypothetical protein